ncbi:MAG: 2-hydroxyacid dehydrogenase, partial [Proteobacteria bacterium]|nr:2-hydroxyacid dehydrogenase [Pseudomonadota bacterium]
MRTGWHPIWRTGADATAGNTGLCGGATADVSGRAVVIQLGRLQRVRAIDATNNTITVEAGCTL